MNDARRRELLAEAIDRHVSPEEAAAYLATPISEAERDEVLSLVRWFTGRYPTGADRLAYVRRAYRRWASHQTPGASLRAQGGGGLDAGRSPCRQRRGDDRGDDH